MSPDQIHLAHRLVITPPSGVRNVSKEEFADTFPEALQGGKLSVRILNEVYSTKDAEGLQAALIIGQVFGFPPEGEEVLCDLISEVWHTSHEDVVSAISRSGFSDQLACAALYRATQIVPTYLEYDEDRSLAVKAIWALGKIKSGYAREMLKSLAETANHAVRQAAEAQLRRFQ